MIDELDVWKHIFYEEDERILDYYINKVVSYFDAQEFILLKIHELKEKAIKKFDININLDESLKDYPVELLANKIAEDIVDDIKKDIKIS